MRYNTADSPTANFTWDGYELLETTKTSDIGKSAVAVDANGKPHVVFQSLESYKGKTYYTLTYANRVGSVWSKVAIWPLTLKTSFSGKIEIAIGIDNIPCILMGNKMLKGNSNAATSFETKDLGTAGTSFVIQQNGDIRVSQVINGKYAILSHTSTSPWSSGWTLQESTTPDTGSTLLLANDTLYAARLKSDGIWLQKNLDSPFLAASQPVNTTWQSLVARWSTHNHSKPGSIDLGTRSWNQQNGNLIWYSANLADSRANFYGGPFTGTAPLTVSLFDSSVPREGSNITSWQWVFENNGVSDASAPNVTHTYTTPGKYSVSLAITDSSGGLDKIVMPNLVQVDADSDGDGIPDTLDNCPFAYNPTQLDLNNNLIGDACEAPINRLAKSMYMTGLKTITSADLRSASDVTGIMTDGLLDQRVTLLPANKGALTVQVNKDAANIKKLIMRYYLNIYGNPLNTRVYIMPYNRDLATTIDAGMSGGWRGWNEVDLTPILHKMDGFGLTKFRIVALNDPSGVSINELNIRETLDNKEIAAIPAAVDFGSAEVTTRTTQDFTISNNGAETLNIVRVKPPAWPFSLVSEDCSGKILASYQNCTIKVSFSPLTNGQYHDAVTIDSNDVDSSSFKVPLQGNGVLVLRGMVKDRATGNLLNAIKVEVTDSVKTYTAITDTNGVYMITGLAAGSYTARYSRADYITYSANGSITQSPNNFLDAQLDFNFASINGSVTDGITGAPLAGAKVTVTLSGISSKDPADKTYTCNGATLAVADYNRIAFNDGDKYACSTSYNNSMMFKVRNPNGAEPFTISWNGIGALSPSEILYDPNSMIEYLAQSFKPSKSGKLTRVSFHLPQTPCCMEYGGVYVMLKSKLGGDRGTHIAMSKSVRLDSLTVAPNWVDFDFVTPPMLEADQEYYLEINGTFFENYDTLLNLFWSNSDATSNGYSYRRVGGLWRGSNTLSFRTYLDGQTDIIASPSTSYTGMYGGNKVGLKAYLYGIENAIFPFNQYSDGSDGLSGYNGDDLTGSLTVTDNYAKYYDANGWLSVDITSFSVWSDFRLFVFWKNGLVTDQFDITFNRVLTTTTDANGAYSFPSLLAGNYTITFEKPGYTQASSTGIATYGQIITENRALNSAPPAAIQGTVKNTYTNLLIAGANVTLVDALGTVHSSTTNTQGQYSISGFVDGGYSVTFEHLEYQKRIVTGSVTPGQTAALDAKLYPNPPNLTITAPADGTVIDTGHVVVTGTASGDATSVTVNGITALIVDGTYSATALLNAGKNTITVTASNQNKGSVSQTTTINYLPKGKVSGIVTDAVNKRPLPSIDVHAVSIYGTLLGKSTTDVDGKYSIQNLIDGDFTVFIPSPGYHYYESSLMPMNGIEIIHNPVLIPFFSISSVAVITPTADTSVVSWTTNQLTNSVVEYGETTSYGNAVQDALLTNNHTVKLTGLKSTTTYHYRVSSTNAYGVTYNSGDFTFTTPLFSAKALGDFGNVTVMEATGNFDSKNPDGTQNDQPRKVISQEYFRNHPDKDFLTFFSMFDYSMPEVGTQGFYTEIKNNTQGINRTILDNSAQFGSAGMLQGTIDMGNILVLAANPFGPKLEETLTTLNHELGHRWLVAVRLKNPDGTLNTNLIGRDSAHWSYLLDSKGSLMYGNGWKDNSDGTFTSVSKQSAFSPLDLYLMGMIDKSLVPPMLLIDNPSIDKTKLPELGATITGTAKTITINDIIAAEGERIPNAATSQKQFNVGFVLLTRPGDNATAATQAIETLRKAWAGRFAELTQGKGNVANVPASLEITVDSPAEGTTITGQDVTVSGTVINTSGAETGITVNGIAATVTGNRFIANHVPLIEGANSIEIKATDAKELTTTTTRSVTASPGHFIRITTNIESGTAPMEISLRLEGSFNITSPLVSYTGPVPVTLTQGASPTEYTATLTADGTYTYTASAAGPDGQTYSDIVTVTVVNRWHLDNQLKAKWENMRTALAAGDVATAVTNFNPLTMEIYREQFTSLSASLPTIAAGMGNIMLVKVEDDQAEYDMHDTINDTEYSFYLLFVKGGDGLWKIRNF